MNTLDNRELAAVLAGLRLLQVTPIVPPEIAEIAIAGGEINLPLNRDEIDSLCERLNCEPDVGPLAIIVEDGQVQDLVTDDKRLQGIEAIVIDYDFEGAENTYPVQQFGFSHKTNDWTDDLGTRDALVNCFAVTRPSGINLAQVYSDCVTDDDQKEPA
jgi:hypothetical protein